MRNAILRNHINELQQTKPSIITTYVNIPRVDRFCQFFVWLISFILDRKSSITLSVRQSSSPFFQPGIFKLTTPTIYADGRAAIVGVQRVQERSSRSRVQIML